MSDLMKPENGPVSAPENFTSVSFSPWGIVRYLVYSIIFLMLAHIAGFILDYVMHLNTKFSWYVVRYFDLNQEDNFPSFFSALILAFAALLLFLIYDHQRSIHAKKTIYWLVLGLIFVFMSTDECIQIHEEIAKIIRPKMGNDHGGLLYWAWVVPYAVVVLGVVIYFLRFVLSLPKFTRNMFFLSGFIFVSGALGLEMLEGYFFKLYGLDHIYNRILYFVEETMEMGGVTLFIYALLDFMAVSSLRVSFDQKPRTSKANT